MTSANDKRPITMTKLFVTLSEQERQLLVDLSEALDERTDLGDGDRKERAFWVRTSNTVSRIAARAHTPIEPQVTRPLVVEYHYIDGDIAACPYEGESVFDLFPANPGPLFTHLVIREQTPEEAAT